MITLKPPSLVLHSCDVPGYKYKMTTTWNMPQGASPLDVFFWINSAVEHAPELELRNVVINCHGDPAHLYVGGLLSTPLTTRDVGLFAPLKARSVGTIWLVACKVALDGRGQFFCRQLAVTTGCDVIGADETQFVEGRFYNGGCSFGGIDEFEGTAYRFSPSGAIEVYSVHNTLAEPEYYDD